MRVIDLSVPIENGMEVYPGDPEVSVQVIHDYAQNGWQVRRLVMGSHSGTHVDAFSHMDPRGSTLDEIPLERFFGRAYAVYAHEELPSHTGLIFLAPTGLEALEKIVAAEPPFVGGDLSETLEKALLKQGIVTYTNLNNLSQLPLKRPFMFYGFPLRIKKGDGSPVRALAVLD